MVSELNSLSFRVWYSQEWKSCTFSLVSDFMAKNQNPLIYDPRFEEFMIPSLDNVDGDRDELPMCPFIALRKCLSLTKQYHPEISTPFVSTNKLKKQVSRNTISFWIRSDISHTCESASDEDCRSVRVKVHRKFTLSQLFRRDSAIQ